MIFHSHSILLSFLFVSAVQGCHTCSRGQPSRRGLIPRADSDQLFDWNKLEVSENPNWTPCYRSYECARISMPLNYSEPSGAKAVTALLRSPSNSTKESYKGSVLINDGGPGGSGTFFVRTDISMLRGYVGPDFDIVGFDPRGIGASLPRASFYPSELERERNNPAPMNSVVLGATEEDFAANWARAQPFGDLAKATTKEEELRSLNTENTARDMLSILNALGEDKLQYIGYSYGSVLGTTFATLFPDKIGKMMLDGVADPDDYFLTGLSKTLQDATKAMQTFYDSCSSAGPSACPFWSSTPDEIKANLTSLYNTVRKVPIPAYISETSYGIVDYARLRATVFTSLYSPYDLFPVLAQGLVELSKGNGSAIYSIGEATPRFDCSDDPLMYAFSEVPDAVAAIMCNDQVNLPRTFEEVKAFSENLKNNSEFGDGWDRFAIHCSNFPQYPKDHFTGPVGADTSTPILFVGNTADPVTPLDSAKKVSSQFPGSKVLTQNSSGHSSFAAPSNCTMSHIQSYFNNGTLPEDGTVCETDRPIFSNSTSTRT